MQERFSYFSDIEEQFCRRRGTALICSTLDWALMETWKNAGIPLKAVLRGIDAAFDRYDARPSKTRKINSLAYCAQEVLAAAEEMQEAAVGATRSEPAETGLSSTEIAAYLERNAAELERLLQASAAGGSDRITSALSSAGTWPTHGRVGESPSSPGGAADNTPGRRSWDNFDEASPGGAARDGSPPFDRARRGAPEAALPGSACPLVQEAIRTLRDLAAGLRNTQAPPLEDLERRLTVIEEKLTAVLLAAVPDEQLVSVRADADRELAPYRRKMSAAQIDQLMKQYIHKHLLERYGVPRMSLFYM
ncbi:MAG: hypothetical protein ACE14L_13800 [Terriglobales bacterium]